MIEGPSIFRNVVYPSPNDSHAQTVSVRINETSTLVHVTIVAEVKLQVLRITSVCL
jgi:hypothetical protein